MFYEGTFKVPTAFSSLMLSRWYEDYIRLSAWYLYWCPNDGYIDDGLRGLFQVNRMI